jgi:hypothetical protein
MLHTPGRASDGSFDPLPEIIQIIRDAISDGLIDEDLSVFEHNLRTLHGGELEDYLQEVWDRI